MEHKITISTTETLIINKALRNDLHNDIDNRIAQEIITRINKVVSGDLSKNKYKRCGVSSEEEV